MSTFAQALLDPVDFVRNMALHSLTCQSCKSAPLGPATVVPSLVHVVTDDPNPNMRGKAITLLLRLGGPDDQIRATVRRAATTDPTSWFDRPRPMPLRAGSSPLASATNGTSGDTPASPGTRQRAQESVGSEPELQDVPLGDVRGPPSQVLQIPVDRNEPAAQPIRLAAGQEDRGLCRTVRGTHTGFGFTRRSHLYPAGESIAPALSSVSTEPGDKAKR